MKRFLQATACATLAMAMAGSAIAADFTLKISSPTNNDVTLQWMQAFEQKVEAGSDGRIDVQLYPANQLGQIPATIEGVSFGTIEATAPASSFYVKYDKRFEALDVPGMYKDLAHAQRVLSDPKVLENIATFGADQGLRTIAVYPHGALGLLSSKAFDKIGALNGQKIRIAGPTALNTEPMRALGASPISMPLGEVLPAMQNGTVDGLLAALPVFLIFKYYDVATDLTVLPESYLVVAVTVSTSFLDSIGPELTEVVMTASREALEEANAWNLKAANVLPKIWEKNGGATIALSAEDSKAYLDAVANALPKAYEENAQLKSETDFLRAAAKRLAQ